MHRRSRRASRPARMAAALLAFSLSAAACGSGEPEGEGAATSEATDTAGEQAAGSATGEPGGTGTAAETTDASPAGGDGSPMESAEVSLGQVVPSMGFLSVDLARAFDTFEDQSINLEWSLISGGDPAALSALDAGDIDLAAVGLQSPLVAISEGQPYQLVFSVMSMMSPDLTVSDQFLERTGVGVDAPLEERLSALEGATIGVSAIGGAQERIARWLVDKAGLDPQSAIDVVLVGPPPALRASLEQGQIDGFVLTAPNGPIAAEQGFGNLFVRLGEEIDEIGPGNYYHTGLVARQDWVQENTGVMRRTATAMSQAVALPEDRQASAVAEGLGADLYPEVDPGILTDSVSYLNQGLVDGGRMGVDGIEKVLEFTRSTGFTFESELSPSEGQGEWWTNEYIGAGG